MRGVLWVCSCLMALLPAALHADSPDVSENAQSVVCPERPQPATAPQIVFPLEFQVTPQSRLYLYGERVYQVRLTTAPGESLYLNGVAILPPAHRDTPWYEPPSDEDYLKWFGDVPFVRELLAQGVSPSDAAERYYDERERISQTLVRSYCEARAAGEAALAALEAAVAGLPTLDDRGLIDWERRPTVASSGVSVRICWRGIEDCPWTTFESPCKSPRPYMPSEEDKVVNARWIYQALTREVPGICLIGFGGFTLAGGAEDVARMDRELDSVLRSGKLADVHLMHENDVRAALEAQKKRGGLPN